MNIKTASRVAPFLFALAALLIPRPCPADEAAPLELSVVPGRGHDVVIRPADAGATEVRTTGRDAYVFLRPADGKPLDLARRPVLEFEYFSTSGVKPFRVRLDPVPAPEHLLAIDGLGISQGWSRRAIDLTPLLGDAAGRAPGLRLDLAQRRGRALQVRSIRLRPRNEAEQKSVAEREAKRRDEAALETALRDYLGRSFPCSLDRVVVDGQRVTIEGRASGDTANLFLASAGIAVPVTEARAFHVHDPIRPDASGRFTVGRDRRTPRGDHLLDRWAVVAKAADGSLSLRSHFRYTDDVRAPATPPWPTPKGRKGVGALWPGRPLEDLDDLGISWATVNIGIHSLIRTSPGDGRTAFEAFGKTWYADDAYVDVLDRTLREAAKRQIIVSAIILVAQAGGAADPAYGKLVAHPDADPAGIYVMPNLTTREGVQAYAAALEFLARRYCRADGQFGRIHHWILHNEVDAGWVWTNAGEKSALLYTDLYQRSMRMAHLIARQYDPRGKAFISLTHYWAKPGEQRFYASRELLNLLLQFSRVEGDFDWAIAHHPYPQDLGNPRVWEDRLVDFTFDTPQITFKNLEVLDAWVRQPRAMYLGKHRRTVHLTEQGLNSRGYGEQALRDQAAGMAYTWKKLEGLESIEAFHYHNWVDNRGEGGLQIGLRRFPDDKDDPHGKKPIWFVYQAADSDREAAVFEPYKAVVGVKDWTEVRHTAPVK